MMPVHLRSRQDFSLGSRPGLRPRLRACLILVGVATASCIGPASAQIDYEAAPIHYGRRPADDRIATVARRLEKGTLQLESAARHGLLPALLRALEIPVASQCLVFSKTSFQSHRIDPAHPRAVYFNDDTYVGWLPDSRLIEFAAADADQGAVFYTLDDRPGAAPRIVRDVDQCLICHASQRTQGVPGFLVRSVLTNPAGRFVSGAPTRVTDDASPFAERWGGWYVTGSHGSMRHLGNSTYPGQFFDAPLDVRAGANRATLPEVVAADRYPIASSDIVALLVLEHQTQMHNLITRAGFEARAATHLDAAVGVPAGRSSEGTRHRIAQSAERLLRALLMADAIGFDSPVRGTSGFAAGFSARGPHDALGRSLHELDLDRRLFAHSCSPLIHGAAFAGLPEAVKRQVGGGLHRLLCAGENVAGFEHLGRDDRETIASILAATEPDFWWTFVVPPPVVAPPSPG